MFEPPPKKGYSQQQKAGNDFFACLPKCSTDSLELIVGFCILIVDTPCGSNSWYRRLFGRSYVWHANINHIKHKKRDFHNVFLGHY
jgi:hypothetical protein